MELFHRFLILLCVTFCCISPATASYSAPSSKLQKRQREFANFRLDSISNRCAQVFTAAQCSAGLAQALADVYVDCRLPIRAMAIQRNCQRNSNGDYCVSVNAPAITSAIYSTCQGSDTGVCAEECRNLLIETCSNMGCCINTLNSTTNRAAFSYPLWSNCGVEPITEECPSLITLRDSDPDGECDGFDLQVQATELSCTRSFQQPIKDALTEAGDCESTIQFLSERCTVDKEGEWCDPKFDGAFDVFVQVDDNCDIHSENCTGEYCRETMERLHNKTGCCLNVFIQELVYWIGEVDADTIAFLYQSCDIKPPARSCEVRLNGNALSSSPLTTNPTSGYLLLLTFAALCALFY